MYGDGYKRALKTVVPLGMMLTGCGDTGSADRSVSGTPSFYDQSGDLGSSAGRSFVGLEPFEVVEALGTPSILREERSGQYWRYTFSGCMLDLYIYKNGGMDEVYYALWRMLPSTYHQPEPDGMCLKLARYTQAETPAGQLTYPGVSDLVPEYSY